MAQRQKSLGLGRQDSTHLPQRITPPLGSHAQSVHCPVSAGLFWLLQDPWHAFLALSPSKTGSVKKDTQKNYTGSFYLVPVDITVATEASTLFGFPDILGERNCHHNQSETPWGRRTIKRVCHDWSEASGYWASPSHPVVSSWALWPPYFVLCPNTSFIPETRKAFLFFS